MLEDVFELRFTEGELRTMVNVGTIHDVLAARIPHRPGRCETSMVFYRLRRALIGTSRGTVIRPGSTLPLSVVRRPKVELARLSKATGLRLPWSALGPLGATGCLLALVTAIGLVAALAMNLPMLAWVAGLALIATVAAFALDQGRLPDGLTTVGDLARATSPLNYGRLVRDGARSDGPLLWTALCEVIADVAELSPDQIGRETSIYR